MNSFLNYGDTYRLVWTARLSVSSKNTVVGKLAGRHKITVQLYPLLSNRVNNMRSVTFSGLVLGNDKNIQEFLAEFKCLPQMEHIEINETHFLCRYHEKEGYDGFYNPEIIYLEPWVIDGFEGMQSLHLGSWNRLHLTELINTLGLEHQSKLLKIVKSSESNIFLFNIRPKLTDKQREAIELAVGGGYYDHPRKVSVEDLAKKAGRAFSTFQAHLRKAERKIIPFFFRNDTYR